MRRNSHFSSPAEPGVVSARESKFATLDGAFKEHALFVKYFLPWHPGQVLVSFAQPTFLNHPWALVG